MSTYGVLTLLILFGTFLVALLVYIAEIFSSAFVPAMAKKGYCYEDHNIGGGEDQREVFF